MKTETLITGIQLLDSYRKVPGGYNIGARDDRIYLNATDNGLSALDVNKMQQLGFSQEDETEYVNRMQQLGLVVCWPRSQENEIEYDPNKGWICYV